MVHSHNVGGGLTKMKGILLFPLSMAVFLSIRSLVDVTNKDSISISRDYDVLTMETALKRESPGVPNVAPVATISIPETPDTGIMEYLVDIIPAENRTLAESPTCQVKLFTRGNDEWILQVLDEKGQEKRVGGDEFMVRYYTPSQANDVANFIPTDGAGDNSTSVYFQDRVRPAAVAMIKDNQDGTYSLDFREPPPFQHEEVKDIRSAGGALYVNFIYTNGIGRRVRPSKDSWKTGGFLHNRRYTSWNLTSVPSIKAYEPPHIINEFTKLDKLLCLGDSLVLNFCGKFYDRQDYFILNNLKYFNASKKVGSDMMPGNIDKLMEIIEEYYGDFLRGEGHSKGILVGSAAWQVQSNIGPLDDEKYTRGLAMCQELVEKIRQKYKDVTIFWKSPSATHIFVADDIHAGNKRYRRVSIQQVRDRFRYMNHASYQYLYEEQKKLMNALDVPFLDVFETTYLSSPHRKFALIRQNV